MKTENSSSPQTERGLGYTIGLFAGGLMLLFSALGVVSTLSGWIIKVKNVPLPSTWEETLGLFGGFVVYAIFFSILTYVGPVQRFGRKRPWIMALLVILALVGLIVGITIWDNGNIKQRQEAREAQALADSLDRTKDNEVFFQGGAIPYRLAVLNGGSEPMEVWADSLQVGTVAPLGGLELQLPWEDVRIIAKVSGKEIASTKLKIQGKEERNPAILHAFNPIETGEIWLYDYKIAYENGKLKLQDQSLDLIYADAFFGKKEFDIKRGGPFYILPGQKAPETTTYHAYRLTFLPEVEPRDRTDFVNWLFHRIDTESGDALAPGLDELYQMWKDR
jgi:hypothetical protein